MKVPFIWDQPFTAAQGGEREACGIVRVGPDAITVYLNGIRIVEVRCEGGVRQAVMAMVSDELSNRAKELENSDRIANALEKIQGKIDVMAKGKVHG